MLLRPHRLVPPNARLAHEMHVIENGNWKLVWENNRECYHCGPNHPELCRTFPEAPTVAGVEGASDDPVIVAHWTRCEALGLPSRFEISADGQYRASRIPLMRDAVTAIHHEFNLHRRDSRFDAETRSLVEV